MKTLVRQFDTTVTEFIQYIPRSFDPFFLAITRLGDPITVLAIAFGLGVWAFAEKSYRYATIAIAIPTTLLIGYGLKLFFERARPMLDLGYNMRLDSFSFPSGHSSGSMVTYGLLAYIAWHFLPSGWNVLAVIILGLIPILVGISRVYLGVHYPSDVLAGWLLGLVAIAIVIFWIKPLV